MAYGCWSCRARVRQGKAVDVVARLGAFPKPQEGGWTNRPGGRAWPNLIRHFLYATIAFIY
jgi:hypothetical protein